MHSQKRSKREQAPPSAPESYPPDVRKELGQYDQTHRGQREAGNKAEQREMTHMGATETAVTPIVPPMKGPGDLLGRRDDGDDQDISPDDELTPG